MSDLFLLKVRSLSGKIINYGDNFALTSLNFNLCLQDSPKYLLVLEATFFVYHCEYLNLFIYLFLQEWWFIHFFSYDIFLYGMTSSWSWILSMGSFTVYCQRKYLQVQLGKERLYDCYKFIAGYKRVMILSGATSNLEQM